MKHGRRTFTAAYKTYIVLEWLGNSSSQTEICRRELLSLETPEAMERAVFEQCRRSLWWQPRTTRTRKQYR